MRGSKKRWGTRSCRRRRDSTEWVRLYRDVDSEVRSWFAARVASEQDVDDLAGEVLAKLAQNDRPDDLKAYMATASANALADYRRRKARERDLLRRLLEVTAREDEIPFDEPRDPSEEGKSNAERGEVEEVLSTLPRAQAQLLRLRFLEGLRMAEVARRVGCSREAAYKRLQRISKRLRERYGVEPPTLGDGKSPKNS
jgi:RNA polymerase sigma-70 factor (ECF subfamily)